MNGSSHTTTLLVSVLPATNPRPGLKLFLIINCPVQSIVYPVILNSGQQLAMFQELLLLVVLVQFRSCSEPLALMMNVSAERPPQRFSISIVLWTVYPIPVIVIASVPEPVVTRVLAHAKRAVHVDRIQAAAANQFCNRIDV